MLGVDLSLLEELLERGVLERESGVDFKRWGLSGEFLAFDFFEGEFDLFVRGVGELGELGVRVLFFEAKIVVMWLAIFLMLRSEQGTML